MHTKRNRSTRRLRGNDQAQPIKATHARFTGVTQQFDALYAREICIACNAFFDSRGMSHYGTEYNHGRG